MKIRDLVLGAMFIALGLVIPQLFHVFGPAAGTVLLPMHISVFLAGLTLGAPMGLLVGLLTPVFSYLVTGMPPMAPVPMMVLMMFELGGYGLAAGLLYRLCKSHWLALIGSMIVGRVILGLTVWLLAPMLGFHAQPLLFVKGGLITGWPGLMLQLVLIPLIMTALTPVMHQRGYAR